MQRGNSRGDRQKLRVRPCLGDFSEVRKSKRKVSSGRGFVSENHDNVGQRALIPASPIPVEKPGVKHALLNIFPPCTSGMKEG